MNVRCPHCRNPIEFVEFEELHKVCCPSCGSSFSLVEEETLTFRHGSQANVGRFELLEQVGVGAFGRVWKARDTELAVTDDYIIGTVRVLNVPTLTDRFSIKGHNMQTSAIDFLPPAGSRMMTASADGTVKFWDMDGAQVGSLTVQDQVRNARFTQDGNAIVTASTEGFVRLWRALPRP